MAEQEFSFEKALEELQRIVSSLETGNVSLDASLELYERGVELVRLCNQRLEDVGQRVDILRTGADGTLFAEPFTGGNEQ